MKNQLSLRLNDICISLLICLLIWTIPAADAQAKDLPLFVDAVDYSKIPLISDCEETLYRGKPRLYSRCANPDELFKTARRFALQNSLPLLIMWGFDSCPACEEQKIRLFDPDMSPTNKAISASLSDLQKTEFSNYTNGKNQIAVVRINSGTSIKQNQVFAKRIGANALADTLGWEKVWSPMFMVVNPETSALASNTYFAGYEFCTFGEKLALGLEQTNIISKPLRVKKLCSMPSDPSDEDLENWTKACTDYDSEKCFWLGKYKQFDYFDMRETDEEGSMKALKSAEAFFAKACVDGIALGCYNEGWAIGKKGEGYARQSTDLMKAACKRKIMIACRNLASRYQDGAGGLRRSTVLAAQLFAEVCDTHDPSACSALGEMAYYKDKGTEPYQSKTSSLLGFGCRDEISWACELEAKL